MLELPCFCLCLCVCSENLWGRNWNEKEHFCSALCLSVSSVVYACTCGFIEMPVSCQVSGAGVPSSKCLATKQFPLLLFASLASALTLFFLDFDMRLLVAAACFSWRLRVCHGTVTVFSLCAPSLLFPSHSAFLFDVLSLLTAGPGRYTCLILSWATTWPRQCCSSNCHCGPLVFLPGSYTDCFWHPVFFPCFFFNLLLTLRW